MHSEDQMFELPFEAFQDEVDLTPKAAGQLTEAVPANVNVMADEAEAVIELPEVTGSDLDHDEPAELAIDSADVERVVGRRQRP